MFCISVLVGYGTKRLFEHRTAFARMLPFLIPVFILVEFSVFPLSTMTRRPEVPKIYRQLGREEENYTILDLPLGDPYERYNRHCRYMLCQTAHGKKIVGGAVFRRPSSLQVPIGLYPNMINSLESGDLRYVMLHKLFLREKREQLEGMERILRDNLDFIGTDEETSVEFAEETHRLRKVTADILVYRVEGEDIDEFNEYMGAYFSGPCDSVINIREDEIFLGTGWSGDGEGGSAKGGSTIFIPMTELSDHELILRVSPRGAGELSLPVLALYVNKEDAGELTLTSGWREYRMSVPASFWRRGGNKIEFRSKYGGPADRRTPAVAFDYVKLEKTQ